mmetsp:Transcript_11116/g.31215  ORF Transcript_11116/g.31215 Transcript_11116/m.31215 type:complete len:215 (-) Transcript_11116:64-708(-)
MKEPNTVPYEAIHNDTKGNRVQIDGLQPQLSTLRTAVNHTTNRKHTNIAPTRILQPVRNGISVSRHATPPTTTVETETGVRQPFPSKNSHRPRLQSLSPFAVWQSDDATNRNRTSEIMPWRMQTNNSLRCIVSLMRAVKSTYSNGRALYLKLLSKVNRNNAPPRLCFSFHVAPAKGIPYAPVFPRYPNGDLHATQNQEPGRPSACHKSHNRHIQ